MPFEFTKIKFKLSFIQAFREVIPGTCTICFGSHFGIIKNLSLSGFVRPSGLPLPL